MEKMMKEIIKDINKLGMAECSELMATAVNEGVAYEFGSFERETWDKIFDLASERFAKLYVKFSKEEAKKANKVKKPSAKVDFVKYEHEDIFGEIEYRQLCVDITLTANSEEEVNELWDKFTERLEEVSYIDIRWSTCPTIEEEKEGVWTYFESFVVDYEHGMMTEIKKDFMADFKSVKKEMGIR